VLNDPVNWVDPTGLFLDILADAGFIAYDFYRLFKDNIVGNCDNLGSNLAALGGDVAGAFIPFVTGLGTASRGAPKIGDKVYRVFGGEARGYGRSWTRVNPHEVPNYRDVAGLPNQNSGGFVVEGRIIDTTGIQVKTADPLHGNKGGLDELVIGNTATQIRFERVYGVNPPF
jgi:hypothetical protein